MSKRKEFRLGAILTGTTGRMLCESGFGEFHELAEFLCGGPVWTHELPSLEDVIRADLLRQHPGLPTEVEADGGDWHSVVAGLMAEHGETLEVEPIPDYSRTKGPMETAVEAFGTQPPTEAEMSETTDQIREQAVAEIEKRKRDGTWSYPSVTGKPMFKCSFDGKESWVTITAPVMDDMLCDIIRSIVNDGTVTIYWRRDAGEIPALLREWADELEAAERGRTSTSATPTDEVAGSDAGEAIAQAVDELAWSLRGDSSLAGHSTIPDNLAELAMALHKIPDAVRTIRRGLDDNFTDALNGHSERANVVDGLFAISRGLNRIADAMGDHHVVRVISTDHDK